MLTKPPSTKINIPQTCLAQVLFTRLFRVMKRPRSVSPEYSCAKCDVEAICSDSDSSAGSLEAEKLTESLEDVISDGPATLDDVIGLLQKKRRRFRPAPNAN